MNAETSPPVQKPVLTAVVAVIVLILTIFLVFPPFWGWTIMLLKSFFNIS